MKIEDVVKIMNESNAKNVYKIYIPSYDKEYLFKPLTIAQQKSFSKLLIEMSDVDFDFHIAKLGVIKSLCVDENFDVEHITPIDYLSILCQIHINNHSDKNKTSLKCEKCKESISFIIDFDNIIKKCSNNFIKKDLTYEYKHEDNLYTFILSDPNIIDYLIFKVYMDKINESDNISEIQKKNDKLTAYMYMFINNIKINNEVIDDFKELDFADKIAFLDNTFSSKFIDDENSLFLHILENFSSKRYDNLVPQITCPLCNTKMEGVFTFDNFFTIF